MKYPTRLSDAVHILAFIALYPDCDLTSNKLAESIQTNPAYVRQLMSALRKGGLLVSVMNIGDSVMARRIIDGVREGRNVLDALEDMGALGSREAQRIPFLTY